MKHHETVFVLGILFSCCRTVEQEEGPKENESGFANATDENVTDNASDFRQKL